MFRFSTNLNLKIRSKILYLAWTFIFLYEPFSTIHIWSWTTLILGIFTQLLSLLSLLLYTHCIRFTHLLSCCFYLKFDLEYPSFGDFSSVSRVSKFLKAFQLNSSMSKFKIFLIRLSHWILRYLDVGKEWRRPCHQNPNFVTNTDWPT